MQINLKLLAMQSLSLFVFLAFALFLPAGTIAWPAGWIYLVLFFSFFSKRQYLVIQTQP
jgi:hypothetical protein